MKSREEKVLGPYIARDMVNITRLMAAIFLILVLGFFVSVMDINVPSWAVGVGVPVLMLLAAGLVFRAVLMINEIEEAVIDRMEGRRASDEDEIGEVSWMVLWSLARSSDRTSLGSIIDERVAATGLAWATEQLSYEDGGEFRLIDSEEILISSELISEVRRILIDELGFTENQLINKEDDN